MKELSKKLVPLRDAAKQTGYTPEYLNFLSRKGKLQAEKIGRNWYTTKEWVEKFISQVAQEKGIEKKEAIEEEKNQAVVIEEKQEDKKEMVEGVESVETIQAYRTEPVLSQSGEKLGLENFETQLSPAAALTLAPKNNYARVFSSVSSLIIIMPLIFAVTYFVKYESQKNEIFSEYVSFFDELPTSLILNENSEMNNKNFSSETVSGIVQGEETENSDAPMTGVMLASENFRLVDISIGSGIILANSNDQAELEVYDIRSESFISPKKDEVKLVISWKTNKMAMSEIEYSKNNGQNPKTIKENSFGFNHSVILSELEPRTSYVYKISTKDRWANKIDSNYFGIYTASKPVSVFDMISGALDEVFGWALKN